MHLPTSTYRSKHRMSAVELLGISGLREKRANAASKAFRFWSHVDMIVAVLSPLRMMTKASLCSSQQNLLVQTASGVIVSSESPCKAKTYTTTTLVLGIQGGQLTAIRLM